VAKLRHESDLPVFESVDNLQDAFHIFNFVDMDPTLELHQDAQLDLTSLDWGFLDGNLQSGSTSSNEGPESSTLSSYPDQSIDDSDISADGLLIPEVSEDQQQVCYGMVRSP
jgi:hypothetical protein